MLKKTSYQRTKEEFEAVREKRRKKKEVIFFFFCLRLWTFYWQVTCLHLFIYLFNPRSTWRTSSREKKPFRGTNRKRWRRFRCSARKQRKGSPIWTSKWSICFRRSKELGSDSHHGWYWSRDGEKSEPFLFVTDMRRNKSWAQFLDQFASYFYIFLCP